MNHKGLSAMLGIALIIIPLAGAEAQASSAALKAFPDFLPVRSEFLSSVITAAPVRALAFKPAFRDTPAGRIRISVEREGGSFFVLFLRERNGEYPVGSRGNVIIKRDASTGYVTRVVWYLSDDGASFISLTPKNERTVVDYVVAGSVSRGGLSVSRLIYYFFTNTFGYLHDATRSALDWSLTLGEPGPVAAAEFSAAIVSDRPSGAAVELLKSAADFSNVGRYLSAAGFPDSSPVEETEPSSAKTARFADPRDPALVAVPAWSEALGLAIESAERVVLDGIASGSAFIALVTGTETQATRRLAIVPYRDATGSYAFATVDAESRQPIDLSALVATVPGTFIRLFRVPLPASR